MSSRLLIVGMNYAPELTGVGFYSGDLGSELARRGHEVSVITTAPHYPGWTTQKPYRNWYARERIAGADVQRCPILIRSAMHGLWRLLAPVSFALSSAPLILWHVLRRRPGVVFCVEPTLLSAPAALLAAAMTRARTVLHVQDLEIDAAFAVGHLSERPWLRHLAAWFERRCLKGFDKVVTISEQMRLRLIEKGVAKDRIEVIRNWVDIDLIRPAPTDIAYRAELGVPADAFVVLYSGNIGAKQGLDLLLRAMAKIAHKRRIYCVIAGEGPQKAHLMAKWGHLTNVRFVPFQPYERLGDFLNIADLHVVPQEPGAADLVLPSKLGGILATARPVVVTAEKGSELEEFLRGAGTVVPPADADALANAISETFEIGEPDKTQSALRRTLAEKLNRRNAISAFEALVTGTRKIVDAALPRSAPVDG